MIFAKSVKVHAPPEWESEMDEKDLEFRDKLEEDTVTEEEEEGKWRLMTLAKRSLRLNDN